MAKIHALPIHVANQIAAGEVIERPASVLKELLENSCDAKASQIDIAIEQAGKRLIQVYDNGCGIDKDDLPLALAPHATSKILEAKDLEGVQTLGFRGEALASISSVSRLSICSKTETQKTGWCIKGQEQTHLPEIEPVAHPVGTTIKMQDLFYNTPARRKFLRTDKTESIHIDEVIKKVILSHFDKGFSVSIDEKPIKRYFVCHTEQDRTKRVKKLCGSAFVEQSLLIDVFQNGMRLWGWLGLPTFLSRQPDCQYFFVNGRAIRDRVINHAVRTAYENKVEPGLYPAYILYLDIDPKSVDVNVHPTKHEVRFQESRLVHNFLTEAIESAFEKDKSNFAAAAKMQAFSEPVKRSYGAEPAYLSSSLSESSSFPEYQSIDNFKALFPSLIPEEKPTAFGDVLSVIDERWILTKKDKTVILVDIKSAQKMIAFNSLKSDLEKDGQIQRSALEIPESVLIDENMMVFQSKVSDMKTLGVIANELGPNELLVREVPKALPISELKRLVNQMLGFFKQHPEVAKGSVEEEKLLKMMSYEAIEQEIATKEGATDFLKTLDQSLDMTKVKHKPYKILGHKELDELFAKL